MSDTSSVLGLQVGQYKIVSYLGAGGMAEVFVGEHVAIDRRVAVKALLTEYCQRPEVVERFMNEARALGRVVHPNVVEIYDVGQLSNGRVCLVMELLRGAPLSRVLAERGPLPASSAVAVAVQIAAAMQVAHDQRIIHRDLKPDNIFILDEPGALHVKVLDFGVAKLLDGAGHVQTATKTALGTAAYMSPEQFRSSRQVDHRSDVYALGCVLFEMLTGRPPYPAKNLAQQMHDHAFLAIPSAAALAPGVPPAVDAVLQNMLAKTPDERFGSMRALANALDTAVGGGTFAGLPSGAFPAAHDPANPMTASGNPPPPITGPHVQADDHATMIDPPRAAGSSRRGLWIALALFALAGLGATIAIVATR